MANQAVAIQEYGKANPSLVAGLEARGGHVLSVPVYRWQPPEDTGELEQLIQQIVDGRIDVLLFTSANQAVNLLDVAPFITALENGGGGAIETPYVLECNSRSN